MKLLRYKEQLKTFVSIGLIGLISIIFGTVTGKSICIFYNVTGIPSPSCGMTRAFISLFKGNIADAFKFHPLFPLVFVIPFLFKESRKKYIYLSIFVIIFVWIIRLAILFPSVEPMTYNKSALIPRIIRLIR